MKKIVNSNKKPQFGYVASDVREDDKLKIKEILNNLCSTSDYYYSDVVPHIAGNVADKLHLTFYYGLLDNQIDMQSLNEFLGKIELSNLELGELHLKSGYQNLYQILWINVIDSEGKLAQISKQISKFNPADADINYTFLPHITLAYVQPEFKIKSQIQLPKYINMTNISYFK
jgi:hypothetical protein